MMGTFTKSFGSCGGYIAASKVYKRKLLPCFLLSSDCLGDFLIFLLELQEIIQHLKHSCPAHLYATSMSPPAVQQVISAIKVILGEDGSNRGTKRSHFCLIIKDFKICGNVNLTGF
jgi:serine palmitoyltransferase